MHTMDTAPFDPGVHSHRCSAPYVPVIGLGVQTKPTQGLKFWRNFAEFRRNFSFSFGTGNKYFGIFEKFRFKNSKFKKIRPKFAENHRNSGTEFRFRQSPGFHRKTKWLTLPERPQDCRSHRYQVPQAIVWRRLNYCGDKEDCSASRLPHLWAIV